MRKLIALIATGMVALALSAIPAVAEDTTVDFTIEATGSGLQLSQNGVNTSTLTDGGGALSFTDDTTMSGSLPETTVTDERGDLAATWTVEVSATDPFANVDGDEVALTNVHVYLDAASLTDLTGTVLDGAISGMTVSGAELTAGTANLSEAYDLIWGATSTLVGLGSAPSITYTPSIEVNVPAGTPVGKYETVVTQTVS